MAHLTGRARLELSPGRRNAKCKMQNAKKSRDTDWPRLHFEF
jgi:hypothetical protein